MSILLSVNPPFSGWLVDGEKTIEWRKKPLPVGKAYIYETKKNGGCGMVIGEVKIFNTFHVDANRVGEEAIKEGKVSRFDLQNYAKGQMIGLNFCSFEKRYAKPIPLSDFMRPCTFKTPCPLCLLWSPVNRDLCNGERTITRPPQSWCYCEDLKGEPK